MCAIIDTRLKKGLGFGVFKNREAKGIYEDQKILKIWKVESYFWRFFGVLRDFSRGFSANYDKFGFGLCGSAGDAGNN